MARFRDAAPLLLLAVRPQLRCHSSHRQNGFVICDVFWTGMAAAAAAEVVLVGGDDDGCCSDQLYVI